jgi:hypothetical protein
MATPQKRSVTYNTLKYEIQNLQYPEDLDTSEQYGQNRVLFFINVTGESKLNKNSIYPERIVVDIPPNEYKNSVGRESLEKATEKIGLGGALRSTLPMKRLTSAISLYIPNDLSTSYGVAYGEEENLAGSGLLAQLGSDATSGKAGFGDAAASAALTGVAQMALKFKDVQKITRTTQNTKKEQLFQGVDFRTINFSYQFAPKNEFEAANVLDIIRTFRHHMLPEFADENQFIYIYPSEFEIKYFRGDQESEFLERHFTAVLTNCNINYTPNGQFVTFENGMPSQINMTLTFKELFLASKETSSQFEAGK